MSLINDALKRARDAGCVAKSIPAAPTSSYRFAGGEVTTAGPRAAIAAAALLGALALVGVGFLAVPVGNVMRQVKGAMNHERPAARVAPEVPVAPTQPTEDQLLTRIVEKLKAETPAPMPEPPKFALQGITSQGASREAMVNGCSVRVGDDIEGARVTAIESRCVRLRWREQDLVLRMP
jgi:hypothetical protein